MNGDAGARYVPTLGLTAGDRVRVGNRAVRTVASVAPSAYVNYRDEPIYTVSYVEPGDEQWRGTGNSAIADTLWIVLDR